MLVLVTGLPSATKERFVNALSSRLGAGHVVVSWFYGARPASVHLHVHAGSDAETLVESGWPNRRVGDRPDLVLHVDRETVDSSIDRVLSALRARAAEIGA